jgi:NAD(P)-dependent dehydrogenase (short-subunit alcohol dehydrogenase family)
MNIDLSGKTVLVTGASRGIGRKTAERCAAAGARVLLHYKSNDESAHAALAALGEGNHALIKAPLDKTEGIWTLYEKAFELSPSIDILVNNAGIFEECDLISNSFENWLEVWNRTLQINLNACAHLSFLVSKKMIAKGGGKIINISSRGAFRGEPAAHAYAASKAGMNALGQSLARTLAPHKIYVYTIAPGFVDTDMSRYALESPAGDDIRNQSPMGRVASPDDIAHAVLLMAANGNEYMTGTILDVNGASYLRS